MYLHRWGDWNRVCKGELSCCCTACCAAVLLSFIKAVKAVTRLFVVCYNIILAPLFYFYIAAIQFDAVARARNFP